MNYFILLFLFFVASCQSKKDVSLLGPWQIIRLQGKDSAGGDLYVYDSKKDTSKKYVSFINDTTYMNDTGATKQQDTVRYLLVGDTIFTRRGIRNYALNLLSNDSILITGDDQSAMTIVRVKNQ